MKPSFFLLSFLICSAVLGQQTEKVDLPRGVVYNYCDEATLNKAKQLITSELSQTSDYSLMAPILFVGPVLWDRYQDIESLKNIQGGNVTLLVDKKKLSAKMTQDISGAKLIWDQLRTEVKDKTFSLRKATNKELQYYWSVISFDIDEPLLILETAEHRYILNISPKTLKLVWLDEAP